MASSDREIRIFISSTFRDFMRERDLLVKEIFPELRRKCAQRFVTLTEVDLRWGITEEQANEGQVLPLCLAEIERSRPYFIGLLGERYGWIPDEIAPEVIEREPWLKEHLEDRISVTELEILHGVLNDPNMEDHAFFYFRDPDYVNASEVSKKERRDMVERNIKAEVEEYGEEEATRRTEARRENLAVLKQKIRDSGFPVAEPYPSPKVLARLVRRQFNRLIDNLYPEDKTPDPLVRERLTHEAHAKNKLFACIERPEHLQTLDDFAALADHHGKGLVVTGKSGSGKTSLLAAWSRNWSDDNPEDVLFQHYFGATPDSATPDRFLRRLMGELKERFSFFEEIPNDPEKLRESLPLWLAQIPQDVQVTLALDGLNQLQGTEVDRSVQFLPQHFPPHVTVITSSLEGPALEELRKRGWIERDLPLASETEVDAMVGEYFRIHGRHVDAEGMPLQTEIRRELVAARGAKNPLFLRTVLEELRQFGNFEALPDRVRHYLEAKNTKDLFLRVIGRWKEDFDGKDTVEDQKTHNLVSRSLTHLWAAREGLSEPEWLDLLGDGEAPLPRVLWTPLFFTLESHLSQRDGLFTFGHDFLRQAVEETFVPIEAKDGRKAAHLAIADYFESHPKQREMSPRKAAEWPFQLHAAEVWELLEASLTDIPLFLALYNDRTKWELTGYWHPLREQGREMGARYTGAYGRWIAAPSKAEDHFVLAQLGWFLFENGLYLSAHPLLQQALEARERELGPEHPQTLVSVNNLALLLHVKGDYEGSQPLYERALEASNRVLGPEHPGTMVSVNNLAGLLYAKGDYAGAQPLYESALEGRGRVLGAEHPHTLQCVNNLAVLLRNTGDYEGAQPLYERALEANERVLGPQHPETLQSTNNLAGLLYAKGDYAGAQPLLERTLEARKRVLGPEHPDTLQSTNNLAELLGRTGDYEGAQTSHERTLEARKRVLGPEHPDTLVSVNNLAGLLYAKEDYAGAQPLLEHALGVRERELGPEHPDTLGSVNNLGALLYAKGDYAGAQSLSERGLEGLLRISTAMQRPHPDLQESAGNYADCLEKLGHSAEEIQSTLDELGHRYGFDIGWEGGQENYEPSTKLRPVLEEIMRDQSQFQEIAVRLQSEDPALFVELGEWVLSKQ